MTGTPYPQESAIRSTATRITARSVPSGGSTSKPTAPGARTSPRPCRRRIRGGPSNEQSMTTIRPFSRRWAIVSAPLPTTSRYATVCGSRIRRLSIGPFGETLTCPSSPLGEVPTKNIRCRPIHAASLSSMASKTLPMRPILRVRPDQLARDVLGVAAREVHDLDARELAHPRELALGEVARPALHRLDVALEQLLEAERLAGGVRRAAGVGGADLVDRAAGDHRVHARVDPRVERRAVHDDADQPRRVSGLRGPELVA